MTCEMHPLGCVLLRIQSGYTSSQSLERCKHTLFIGITQIFHLYDTL